MTDYVAKPIQPPRLYEAIARAAGGRVEQEAPAAMAVARTAPVLDHDHLASLRDVIGQAAFREVMGQVMPSVEKTLATLLAAHRAGDTAARVRAAHTLRGVAGNFGAMQLADLASHVVALAPEDGAVALIAGLHAAAAAATREIDRLLVVRAG